MGEIMFKKILYPTDFSDSAKAALEYVKKLKEAGAEEVVLLHVYDKRNIDIHWEIESFIHEEEPIEKVKHDIIKAMLEKSYHKLKELEEELLEYGFKTELIVETGLPAELISKVANEINASLIVMGSHGERGIIDKILGSTTNKVLQNSNIPVLVVKPKNNEEKGAK